MSVIALPPSRETAAAESAPLLHWLIFTGACAFAAVLLWQYGLHPSHGGLRPHLHLLGHWCTLGASLHCLWRTIVIGREADAGRQAARKIEAGEVNFAADGADSLPDGVIAAHIRDLARKARTQGAGRLDQTLLLRSASPTGCAVPTASALRQRHADEARPARHDHRLHHHAGADRRARRERRDVDEILDGADERRHGGGDVHDARRPRRLDPAQDSVLHARRRDPARVLATR